MPWESPTSSRCSGCGGTTNIGLQIPRGLRNKVRHKIQTSTNWISIQKKEKNPKKSIKLHKTLRAATIGQVYSKNAKLQLHWRAFRSWFRFIAFLNWSTQVHHNKLFACLGCNFCIYILLISVPQWLQSLLDILHAWIPPTACWANLKCSWWV